MSLYHSGVESAHLVDERSDDTPDHGEDGGRVDEQHGLSFHPAISYLSTDNLDGSQRLIWKID